MLNKTPTLFRLGVAFFMLVHVLLMLYNVIDPAEMLVSNIVIYTIGRTLS